MTLWRERFEWEGVPVPPTDELRDEMRAITDEWLRTGEFPDPQATVMMMLDFDMLDRELCAAELLPVPWRAARVQDELPPVPEPDDAERGIVNVPLPGL
jgi:hypothetical protein